MDKLPRNPTVKNRYSLTIEDISKLKVGNKDLIKPPLFWYNEIICAWCICDSSDNRFHEDSYWIGIYTDYAPKHANKFKFDFTSFGGMTSYNFKTFFDPEEIKNEYDLIIQEKFLEKINELIDLGVLVIPKTIKRKK